MSSSRFGKWADADEDDDEFETPEQQARSLFATKADASGIRKEIEYKEKDGRTYKLTRRIRTTTITSWTNEKIIQRKSMTKFGKPAVNDPAAEKNLVVRSEEISIELSKKTAVNVNVKDEAADKFYEESLAVTEGMTTVKKSWTDMNRSKQVERDGAGAERPAEPDKALDAAAAANAVRPGAPEVPRAYVPPILRPGGDGKGKGKGKGFDAQQEVQSLRVTNLSDDVKEGDLQDLFGSVGRLQRARLAKDENGYSRGVAFITYHTREDALKAIKKLHGYGYDNLIMQVQFAEPRT